MYNPDDFLSKSATPDSGVLLSSRTVALCLSALDELNHSYQWDGDTSDYDDIDASIGAAIVELLTIVESGGDDVGFYVGDIMMRSHAIIDPKWLQCDGTELSRETYSDLFSEIGEMYGAGNGTTTFNIPDFRGRVPMAQGTGIDLSPRTTGDMIGAETHQLTISEMPSHNHTLRLRDSQAANNLSIVRAGNADPVAINAGAVGNRGNDTPHNNIQPSICVHFVIRVLP